MAGAASVKVEPFSPGLQFDLAAIPGASFSVDFPVPTGREWTIASAFIHVLPNAGPLRYRMAILHIAADGVTVRAIIGANIDNPSAATKPPLTMTCRTILTPGEILRFRLTHTSGAGTYDLTGGATGIQYNTGGGQVDHPT